MKASSRAWPKVCGRFLPFVAALLLSCGEHAARQGASRVTEIGVIDATADSAMQPSRADSSVTGDDMRPAADASAEAPASDRKTCTQNADCAEEEFCEKASCDVSFPGTCQLRPGQTSAAPCSLTLADLPVCGCDGIDYSAACVAYTQGVNVSYYGQCPNVPPPGPAIQCVSDDECSPGYCEKTACGALSGVCAPPLHYPLGYMECLATLGYLCDGGADAAACAEETTVVCGCNGKWYADRCAANVENTGINPDGGCPPISDAGCQAAPTNITPSCATGNVALAIPLLGPASACAPDSNGQPTTASCVALCPTTAEPYFCQVSGLSISSGTLQCLYGCPATEGDP
jgi:hypothetical protein